MVTISNDIAAELRLNVRQYADFGAYFSPFASEGPDIPVDLTGVDARMSIYDAAGTKVIDCGIGTGLFVFDTNSLGYWKPAGINELPEGIYYGDLKLKFPDNDIEYPFNVIYQSIKSYTT